MQLKSFLIFPTFAVYLNEDLDYAMFDDQAFDQHLNKAKMLWVLEDVPSNLTSLCPDSQLLFCVADFVWMNLLHGNCTVVLLSFLWRQYLTIAKLKLMWVCSHILVQGLFLIFSGKQLQLSQRVRHKQYLLTPVTGDTCKSGSRRYTGRVYFGGAQMLG